MMCWRRLPLLLWCQERFALARYHFILDKLSQVVSTRMGVTWAKPA